MSHHLEDWNRPTPEQKKYYKSLKGKRGENTPGWKDNPGKSAVHIWLNTNYGKPKKCDECKTTDKSKIYEWANKDHTYKRLRDDFRRLCRSCHRKYDKVIPPSWKGKHHTEESKLKIRKFAITRKWNEEGFIKI